MRLCSFVATFYRPVRNIVVFTYFHQCFFNLLVKLFNVYMFHDKQLFNIYYIILNLVMIIATYVNIMSSVSNELTKKLRLWINIYIYIHM